MADTTTPGTGRITRIIGAVVDVEFPPDAIPAMYNALKVTVQATSAGEEPHEITLEVAQHLGDNIVRTISSSPPTASCAARWCAIPAHRSPCPWAT